MRILEVTQTYSPFFEFGGPPTKVRALAEGLAALGNEVTVLTADWGLDQRLLTLPDQPPAENSPFGRRQKLNGVTALYLANWLHYRAISWNPALPRYLRARLQQFDAVHIFGLYDILGLRVAAACRERKIPYVVEPIGMFLPIVRNFRLKRFYHRLFGVNLFAGAAAIIATAEQESAELISGGIARDKIVLRRNGVDIPESFPARGVFRRSIHVPDDAKLLLFLGRLSAKKNPDLLLRAFAEYAASGESTAANSHLVFVGPDEAGMRGRLEKAVLQLSLSNRVHFSGPLAGEMKLAAYRDSDIFVLPSQNENFGNTAAEAVAAGTPVIVTGQCGIAPLLDGKAGLVVACNQRELAAAIRLLLTDDSVLGRLRNACAPLAQELTWTQPIQEMNNLFLQLAASTK
jgi:glycosyltransferase involved in cell wall biosynthesis